jgi:uncharacterized protein YerC
MGENMKQAAIQMNKTIESQVYKILFQVLANTKNEIEIEQLLAALLSPSELQALAKRLAIGVFLDKGQSYQHIRDTLKVSSATIAGVAENMNKKGMQLALQQVKAEEWADMWSIRISRALEKIMK